MLVRNENQQLVNTSTYTNEILNEGLGADTVTEAMAQNALAELYISANQDISSTILANNRMETFVPLNVDSFNLIGLWTELKRIFCSIVKEDSTYGKIIDAILEAIASIIPLGKLVKKFVKVIIKFFLQEGIDKVCPVK